MPDLNVSGLDEMVRLSKALKQWDTELRKEMTRGFTEAVKPILPDVKAELVASYPKRGGLSKRMEKARPVAVFQTGKDPGVKILIRGLQVKLGEVYGIIRHPVYADKDKTRREWTWREQRIAAHNLQEYVQGNLQPIANRLSRVLDRTAQKVLDKGVK